MRRWWSIRAVQLPGRRPSETLPALARHFYTLKLFFTRPDLCGVVREGLHCIRQAAKRVVNGL